MPKSPQISGNYFLGWGPEIKHLQVPWKQSF
jgi:hypothetical protein